VENLNVSARHGLMPYSRQTRATVSRLTPSSRASRRVDQWVVQPGWGRVERDLEDLSPVSPAHGLRPTWPGPISEPSQPAVHVAAAAGDDSWARNAHTLGDLGVGHTIGGQEQDAGPLDEHGRQPAGPCPAA
jgi:hypothetical protein